jgi:predicted ATP-grasp superfamily ATP-dependent carboligase
VWRLHSEEQRQRAIREETCFQRYIEGQPAAAVFAVFADRSLLLGATKQLVGSEHDHRWRYRGSVSLPSIDLTLTAQFRKIGDALTRDFQLRGLVGVDLVIAQDRAWVVEINPRYSASVEVVEMANRLEAIPLHIAACTNGDAMQNALKPQADPGLAHAKAIMYAPRDVTISPAFFEWAMERTGAKRLSPDLADIPSACEHIMAGSPVLTVFAAGDDCERLLSERLAEVESRLYAAP